MSKNYQIINYCLISIFILGGIYFLLIFFNLIEGTECHYQQLYGKPCPTCGLTRSFMLILKQGSFNNITFKFQIYFLFLNYVIWSRFIFLLLIKWLKKTKLVIYSDIALSSILAIGFGIVAFS